MQQLEQVYEATQLERGAVYQIDNCLYQYQYSDPYARPDRPKFKFSPLAGQRKKVDLILGKEKIRRCYLVPGYRASQVSEVSRQAVQLSLF
ncbi:hypothetical protein [Tolypothrix sp. VBCCA 56010]|uniref:hypothetical protein n=1 Tax=Tolypothrix sp. VBCCA 56010 TaxID=3137731 RepID=UPI003D7EB232